MVPLGTSTRGGSGTTKSAPPSMVFTVADADQASAAIAARFTAQKCFLKRALIVPERIASLMPAEREASKVLIILVLFDPWRQKTGAKMTTFLART